DSVGGVDVGSWPHVGAGVGLVALERRLRRMVPARTALGGGGSAGARGGGAAPPLPRAGAPPCRTAAATPGVASAFAAGTERRPRGDGRRAGDRAHGPSAGHRPCRKP